MLRAVQRVSAQHEERCHAAPCARQVDVALTLRVFKVYSGYSTTVEDHIGQLGRAAG